MKYWTDKFNRKIRLTDLDNEHLTNIINMLKGKAIVNKFKERFEITNLKPSNEQAAKIKKKELELIEKKDPEYYYPIYKYLIKEQMKRKKRSA